MAKYSSYPQVDFKESQRFLPRDPSRSEVVLPFTQGHQKKIITAIFTAAAALVLLLLLLVILKVLREQPV